MTTFEYVMIYIMCWWLALMMLLPIKAQRPVVAQTTAYAAAPARSYIKYKLLGATALSVLMTAMIAVLFHSPVVMAWLAGS